MHDNMICSADFLAVDQPLNIHSQNLPAALNGKISDIEPGFLSLLIQLPANGCLPRVKAGDELQVSIPDKHCVYRFDSIYQHKNVVDDLIWYISKPEQLEKQQQRRFIRVPVPLPIQIKAPNVYGGFRNARSSVTIDISGGGLCFVSMEPIAPDSRIDLAVAGLPILNELSVLARVVRCTPVIVSAGCIYHIGVSLEESLSEVLKNKLIHSVFCLQRRYLSNGIA